MVKIGNLLIIHHIIKFMRYGCKDFIICGGYKYKLISKYFKKMKLNSNVKVINTA